MHGIITLNFELQSKELKNWYFLIKLCSQIQIQCKCICMFQTNCFFVKTKVNPFWSKQIAQASLSATSRHCAPSWYSSHWIRYMIEKMEQKDVEIGPKIVTLGCVSEDAEKEAKSIIFWFLLKITLAINTRLNWNWS